MLDAVVDLLACPHEGASLSLVTPTTTGCPTGHRFDLGRGGYVNLSGPAGPPHSADTAAMVLARERAQRTGVHEALTAAVVRMVLDAGVQEPVVLDVGAGNGLQLSAVLDATDGRGIALDASTAAARRAGRAHPRAGAVVADVWAGLPVRDGAVDVVLNVFAPRNGAEFSRVLAAEGIVVVVTPAPTHLAEVRAALGLLGVAADKRERLHRTLAPHLTPGPIEQVRDEVLLDPEQLRDVAAMGPSAAHLSDTQLVERIAAVSTPIRATVAVEVAVFAATGSARAAQWVPGRTRPLS